MTDAEATIKHVISGVLIDNCVKPITAPGHMEKIRDEMFKKLFDQPFRWAIEEHLNQTKTNGTTD